MPTRRILLFLTLLLVGQVQAYDFGTLADRHVAQAYQALAQHNQALQQVADDHCGRKPVAAVDDFRARFRTAFLAWQGAQHLRFGPVQYLSREHRFAMWPDKRGTVRKHLAALKQDADLMDAGFDISSKSVAVQGYSALERLLFENDSLDAKDCRIATAIAANLVQMSDSILHDWFEGTQSYAGYFRAPGPLNPLFASDAELAGQLLNSLYTELELIVTQKLARPLGDKPLAARGQRAEGWRSGTGLAAVAANLRACESLYRLAFAEQLGDTPLARDIESQLQLAHQILNGIDLPLAEAVGDARARSRVEQLQRTVSRLKGLVGRDMAAALELSLGFNSLDGD